MNLVLEVALTHVRARARQTVVAIVGVATGVGFSIMMAGLMQGSQDDFIRTLVNAMPHVAISDETRSGPEQPATRAFDLAEIHGQTPLARRRGIKNPLATMAALEAWLPGEVAPSVQARGIVRYAGQDRAATIVGIDPAREPRVSQLATQMRQGTLASLYRATNGIILGDRLAERLGARINATIAVSTTEGVRIDAVVVGIFRSGVRQLDETTGYVLIRTAQILAGQTGLVNELRVRLADPMSARDVAGQIEAQVGYKAVSWQEANEDLLNAFVLRNFIMYTVVAAILLVASFGTYNIISTITHEKARDIAIMKSLGLSEATVRTIFVIEGFMIGAGGAIMGWLVGYLLCLALGQVEFRSPFVDATRLPILYSWVHYAIATAAAVSSSVVASWFPSRKAASVHPVEIIRGAT